MFVTGFQRIDVNSKSEIVSIQKSSCGRFFGVLLRDSIQIRNLNSQNLDLLSEYKRDQESIKNGGFNHWVQWINQQCLAVGTQTGHIIFLQINHDGKVTDAKTVTLGKIITAHGSAYGALIVATSGPRIHFIAPTGEVLSTLPFKSGSVPLIIRKIDVSEPVAIFTFSDGSATRATLKQSDIIDRRELVVEELQIKDITSARIGFNKSFVVVLSFTCSLIKLSNNGEINFICENASLFQLTRDGRHIISLSADGYVNVWSSRTMRNTRTKLDFPFLSKSSNPNFITSELDVHGLRFFAATSSDMFMVTFAVSDSYIPSLIYRTPTSAVVPPTNVVVEAPRELLDAGFPLHSAAYGAANKSTVLAGRRCFAIHHDDKWHMIGDRNNVCRALWFQQDYFVSVVFDVTNPQYKLVLLNKDDLSVVSEEAIEGLFVCCDYFQNKIAIGTSHIVHLFSIDDGKLNTIKTVEQLPQFEQVALLNTACDLMIVTNDKELYKFPGNDIVLEGVSHVQVAKQSGLVFVIAHGQEFVMCEDELIRIGAPAAVVDGISLYRSPAEYKCGEFQFETGDFLVPVLEKLFTKPEVSEKLIKSYIVCPGTTRVISRVIDRAIEMGKFNQFDEILKRFGEEARNRFLLISVFDVKPQYAKTIMDALPPYEVLIEKFPDAANGLKELYQK